MSLLRYLGILAALAGTTNLVHAATPKEIDAAIQLGMAYLKDLYKDATPKQVAVGPNGIGAAALAGLALLESDTRLDDPSVRAITAGVRDASYTATQTYHIALCLLYLDRVGDASDEPLIQMLGVRLLAGQTSGGGWTYDCIATVSPLEERTLRNSLLNTELTTGSAPLKPGTINPPKAPNATAGKAGVAGKLHPEIVKYQGTLATVRARGHLDDNSNTQFGILGVWVSRRHGVPVELALDAIETRFLNTQTANGGWPYAGSAPGSPSMTCAGLLGLATAIGRREERRLTAEIAKASKPSTTQPPKSSATDSTNSPKTAPKVEDPFFTPPPAKVEDPFFSPMKPNATVPPPPAKKPEAKPDGKAAPKHPLDLRDHAVQRALASLGAVLAGNAPPQGRGKGPRFLVNGGGALGERDLYFLWSIERVGVVYGLEKIGNVDWYDMGAEELIAAQNVSGSWGRGGRGSEVDTAFALLFLARSNLVHDLTHKVQHGASTAELRAGAGPIGGDPKPFPAAQNPPSGNEAIPGALPAGTSEPRRPEVTIVRPNAPPVEDPKVRTTAPPVEDGKGRPMASPPMAPIEDPKALAALLVEATGAEWEKMLTTARDGKGAAYTEALVQAIAQLDGERLKLARETLAERLTRMTGETLRTMAKSPDAELRRGAILAMAMKDDNVFLDSLIVALLDKDDIVVRAAKAGLKSMTGEDFGPPANASAEDKKAAAKAWLEWLRKP